MLSFAGIVVGLALLVVLRALSGRDLYIPLHYFYSTLVT